MSPLDDELRAALSGRARALSPAPDPLAGIERRARQLRRNRVAAAVAGSALAVASVAAVVPALQSATSTLPDAPSVASAEPSPEQNLTARPANALDWDSPGFATHGLDQAVITAWADVRGIARGEVRGEQLFSVSVPDAEATAGVYQLWVDGGQAYSVVAQGDESQAVITRDTESTPDSPYVDSVVSIVAPYVVVAVAPTVTAVAYAGDGVTYEPVQLARGGGLTLRTLEAGSSPDRLRITDDRLGTFESDLYAGPTDGDPGVLDGEPANLLGDWPVRGDRAAGPPDSDLLTAFATAVQDLEPDGEPQFRALFAGSDDSGLSYVFGQAWMPGGQAYTVGLTSGGESGAEFFLGPVTDADVQLLAFVTCCAPGTTTDTLVVIPEPGTGQVLYAQSADADFTPVGEGQDFLDGVVLVDRDPRATSDRLQLLDGDGDLDKPTFTGDVTSLLCGARDC